MYLSNTALANHVSKQIHYYSKVISFFYKKSALNAQVSKIDESSLKTDCNCSGEMYEAPSATDTV